MRPGVRNAVKEALARMFGLAGRNGPHALCVRHGLLILCYHRVLPETELPGAPLPGLCVGAAAFERQVAYLREHFELLTLSAAASRPGPAPHAARPAAVITFDDGYADNHRVALPVLRRLGVPATVFLVADRIGAGEPLWFDAVALLVREAERRARLRGLACALMEREAWQTPALTLLTPHPLRHRVHAAVNAMKALPEPERQALLEVAREQAGDVEAAAAAAVRLMTWDEVREMAAAGLECGSHTATHPRLPGLAEPRLRAEVHGSRATIEAHLGRPVSAFSYPNGDHDERAVAAVGAAGYTCAVTTCEAPNRAGTPPLLLNRLHVGPRTGLGLGGRLSPPVFAAELLGLFRRQGGYGSRPPRPAPGRG